MFAAESHTSRHHIAIVAMACLCVLLGGPSYAAGAESLDRVPNVGVRGRFPGRRKQEAVIA